MKFFDCKFILVLGLSMVVYLIYREVERLIKRVTKLEQRLNRDEPMKIEPLESFKPLPTLMKNEISVPISTNVRTFEPIQIANYNEGNIYSNDTSANEQDAMLIESITNMTKNIDTETELEIETESGITSNSFIPTFSPEVDSDSDIIISDNDTPCKETQSPTETPSPKETIISRKETPSPKETIISRKETPSPPKEIFLPVVITTKHALNITNLSKTKITELQKIATSHGISITTDGNKKKTKVQLLQDLSGKK